MALGIVGVVLIVLQFIGCAGAAKVGNSLPPIPNIFNISNFESFIGECATFIGYYLIGILGLIFIIIGSKSKKPTIILHKTEKKRYTVLSYVFAVLLALSIALCIIMISSDIYSFSPFALFSVLSSILLILYILFYRNKKPSFLFSVAILLAGIAYIFGLSTRILSLLHYLNSINAFRFITSFILQLVGGIIYIVLAVKLYKEKFSILSVKILGGVGFAVLNFMSVALYLYNLISSGYSSITINIDDFLTLTIFIYTCIVPICNTPILDKEKDQTENYDAHKQERYYDDQRSLH